MNTKLIYKYGIGTGVALILYFVIMKLAGLIHITELRAVNLLILMAGLYSYLKQLSKGDFDYLGGFTSGIYVSGIAVFTFVIFFMFYIDFIEPEFYEYIRDNEPLGNYLNKGAIGFMLIAEGLSSGLVITFIFMQHFKSYLYKH